MESESYEATLLTWTPVIASKSGFPRDEKGNPFLPGDLIREAIVSAAIYYYIKKDREIESRVKNYLLKKGLDPEEVIDRVKSIISEKYPILKDLIIPEKIRIPKEKIHRIRAEVFNLKRWEEEETLQVESFKGTLEIPIASPHMEKIKAAGHSFCEGLARMEMDLLEDHPLVERFYKPLLNDIKKWEIPLRIGMWTLTRYKGHLLFFWKIKEVREALIRELKIDIRPESILYLPREECTTGWCELKINQ